MDGELDWRHVETATLYVRDLSEDFIQTYLDAEWPEVGYSVGVFRLEGRGVQLFAAIRRATISQFSGCRLIPLPSARFVERVARAVSA